MGTAERLEEQHRVMKYFNDQFIKAGLPVTAEYDKRTGFSNDFYALDIFFDHYRIILINRDGDDQPYWPSDGGIVSGNEMLKHLNTVVQR